MKERYVDRCRWRKKTNYVVRGININEEGQRDRGRDIYRDKDRWKL
jgi:hypothetical protein